MSKNPFSKGSAVKIYSVNEDGKPIAFHPKESDVILNAAEILVARGEPKMSPDETSTLMYDRRLSFNGREYTIKIYNFEWSMTGVAKLAEKVAFAN